MSNAGTVASDENEHFGRTLTETVRGIQGLTGGTANRKARIPKNQAWMRVVVSFLGIALGAFTALTGDETQQKFGIGLISTIFGYWLR